MATKFIKVFFAYGLVFFTCGWSFVAHGKWVWSFPLMFEIRFSFLLTGENRLAFFAYGSPHPEVGSGLRVADSCPNVGKKDEPQVKRPPVQVKRCIQSHVIVGTDTPEEKI